MNDICPLEAEGPTGFSRAQSTYQWMASRFVVDYARGVWQRGQEKS